MKRIWWFLLMICMAAYLAIGLRACDYANAAEKQWTNSGTFEQGYYMICANFGDTNIAPYCTGILRFNGTDEQASEICATLNETPTAHDEIPFFFVWKNATWVQIKPPCEWTFIYDCPEGKDCA